MGGGDASISDFSDTMSNVRGSSSLKCSLKYILGTVDNGDEMVGGGQGLRLRELGLELEADEEDTSFRSSTNSDTSDVDDCCLVRGGLETFIMSY